MFRIPNIIPNVRLPCISIESTLGEVRTDISPCDK